jgi:hypothetical protein
MPNSEAYVVPFKELRFTAAGLGFSIVGHDAVNIATRTDRHRHKRTDEINSRFSQLCERAEKDTNCTVLRGRHAASRTAQSAYINAKLCKFQATVSRRENYVWQWE